MSTESVSFEPDNLMCLFSRINTAYIQEIHIFIQIWITWKGVMGFQGSQHTKETEDKEVNQINAYTLFKIIYQRT